MKRILNKRIKPFASKAQKGAQAYRAGLWAETLAMIYFWLKGYRILARRYKTAQGEIDLIVARGHDLVFVEVKARRTVAQVHDALTHRMRDRIGAAASSYISRHPARGEMMQRFDLVMVAPPFFIRHLDNAWNIAT